MLERYAIGRRSCPLILHELAHAHAALRSSRIVASIGGVGGARPFAAAYAVGLARDCRARRRVDDRFAYAPSTYSRSGSGSPMSTRPLGVGIEKAEQALDTSSASLACTPRRRPAAARRPGLRATARRNVTGM